MIEAAEKAAEELRKQVGVEEVALTDDPAQTSQAIMFVPTSSGEYFDSECRDFPMVK